MKRALLVVCLAVSLCRAQDSLSERTGFSASQGWTPRKVIATAGVGGVLVGSLISSYYDWWQDTGQQFHFVDDGVFNNYSLGVDKIGHAYTSYFYFHAFRNLLLWGGYDESTALWWGAGTSALFALSIEIGDGFSPFGFSFPDLLFNMSGLGWGILQAKVPFMQNFNFKWSYVPAEGYRFPPHFTDHYDAHTYWLTVNVHNLLPESMQEYWPALLQVAVGYGATDGMSRRKAAIGFDFNLKSFAVENDELGFLLRTADMIHLPAPAIRFVEGKPPTYKVFYTN
jgi:hypothetical protein